MPIPSHWYSEEEVDFIRRELPGRSHAELTDLFNTRFGTCLSIGQITGAAKNRKICNRRDTRLKPGNVPINKGQKRMWKGGEVTQFKPGSMPHNYRPVGSERTTVDGYVEVKIADPKSWKMKHVILWEQANGPVPKGHAIIFGDGNRQHISLDNLVLVSRKQLAVMNKMGLIGGGADLTELGKNVADVYMKVTERKKR